MSEKVRVELEFVLKSSLNSLENLLTTPSGLSEWYADNVNIKDDIYTFFWDGSEESARLLSHKRGASIKWRWLIHEESSENVDCYFEFNYRIDPLTKDVILKINIVNPADSDEDDIRLMWEDSISDLRNVLGA